MAHGETRIAVPHGDAPWLADPRDYLRRAPRLDPRAKLRHPCACKICGRPSLFFDRVDFNKFCNLDDFYGFGLTGVNVDYARCTRCGFLFTTFFDGWSPDDFRQFVYNDDYLKVDDEYVDRRPTHTADDFARRLREAKDARILDYGSGAGVFVRRMRDHGFTRIEEYDPFSSPTRPGACFDIITSFEVIEHTTDPWRTLDDMLSLLRPDGCIVLGQTLQPDDIGRLRGSWWYLAPRNGHASTYTEEALEHLGRGRGLAFHRGDTIYGLGATAPSRFARVALNSVGPSFSTVRLHAPAALPDAPVRAAGRDRIAWHPTKHAGGRQFRWTGDYPRLQWRANWPPSDRVRVAIPIVEQAAPDFAVHCTICLDGSEAPVFLSRGDLAAEFDAAGTSGGEITLHTPEAVAPAAGSGPPRGLAIATARDPVWPAFPDP